MCTHAYVYNVYTHVYIDMHVCIISVLARHSRLEAKNGGPGAGSHLG